MAASCACVSVLLRSVECVHLSVILYVKARLYQCAHSMYHMHYRAYLYMTSLVRQLRLGMSWDAD